MYIDVELMRNRRQRLDRFVSEFSDRHTRAITVDLPRLDTGKLDELIEQAFDVVELATDDSEVSGPDPAPIRPADSRLRHASLRVACEDRDRCS